MPKLKLGLIGWGRVARLCHADALFSLPEIAIVAVAEPDVAARQLAKRRFPDARPCEDFQQILSSADVDAVVVGLPTFLHAHVATAAFRSGKHVYLEKPLALDLTEARRVVSAWRSAGTVGMIGFNFRHDLRYQEARRRFLAGELGRPLAVRSVFTTARKAAPSWKQSRASGGGALLELASHDFDLVRFVCNAEVLEARAELQSVEDEHDLARVALRMDNGLTVECLFSTCAVDEARLEIYGDRGKLTIDRLRSAAVEWCPAVFEYSGVTALRDALHSVLNRLPGAARLRGSDPLHSYRGAFRVFASAVLAGAAYTPDLEDGYRSLAVVAAAEAAAADNRAVALSEFCDEDSARS
jgi:myo-inositol 2-dehydrogenase/D-chiro-inositol 1-dehydrogenase